MLSPDQSESLRQGLSHAILDHLTDALLQYPSIHRMSKPVLRFEAFIDDGHCDNEHCDNKRERGARAASTESLSLSSREPLVSVSWYSASATMSDEAHTPLPPECSLTPSTEAT